MSEENKSFTQEDIQRYIDDKEEESAYLEFKRGDALLKNKNVKEEIHKDVSAFANSDGGILIYGIEEKNHVATSIVPVDGNDITKEWLEQVINTGIKRRIEGLVIEPLRIDDKIEQTVYVVKIPRSSNAAHMSSDGRYYKRTNFQVVRLEEYEVRDLNNRQEVKELEIADPHVTGWANKTPIPFAGTPAGQKITEYTAVVRFDVINKGRTIERDYKLEIRIPEVLVTNNIIGTDPFALKLARKETPYAVYVLPNSSPLFQNERATVETATIRIGGWNLESLSELPIKIKLLYSSGIEEKSFYLLDHISHKERPLSVSDFS